jgi:hypothetical protein
LSHHKAGVIALLRAGRHGWSGEGWPAYFDERADITEFDAAIRCDLTVRCSAGRQATQFPLPDLFSR